MRSILLSAILALIPFTAFADIDQVIEATCMVNDGGSGVVFAEDDKSIWILTAAHCVAHRDYTPFNNQHIHFFHTGVKSHSIPVELLWTAYEIDTTKDLALLKAKKSDIGIYPLPKVIPLANHEESVRSSQMVISCGCAGGTWPTAWRGYVSYVDEETFKFVPQPKPGRSGSGIFTADGSKVLGIVIWIDGTTVPIWKIYEITKWKQKN